MNNRNTNIDISFYEEMEDQQAERDVYFNREKLSSHRYERVDDERRNERKNARGRGWNGEES